jgi:cytochrome c oxidase cbb3-type subunit 3
VSRKEHDELLDHDADGIHEFDNDLPRWWLYGFYFTIVFAAAYLVNYHVLPDPIYGERTLVAEYEADVAAADARHAALVASGRAPASGGAAAPGGGSTAGGAAVALVALTDQASLDKGRALYESQTNPCAACHRPDLGGLVGPNLVDEMWLHGCSVEALVTSIKTGYPTAGMLPYGGGPALTDEQVLQLASFLLSKRGATPPNPKVPDPARDKACS